MGLVPTPIPSSVPVPEVGERVFNPVASAGSSRGVRPVSRRTEQFLPPALDSEN